MEILTIILDLDGVLICTPPWKKDELHADGYSNFNLACVENLYVLLSEVDHEIWLSSSRRKRTSLEEFNIIFKNRGVQSIIKGFVPDYLSQDRREEIEQFIEKKNINNYLIIDDDKSLNALNAEFKSRLVLTEYLKGFDSKALKEAMNMLRT